VAQPKADSILIAEFEYIAQSAFQVSEDRAKVSSFYLITFGSIFAAVFGANLQGADNLVLSFILAVLFTFLGVYSLLTLMKLAQLRLAWLDSVKAMNRIKRYYLQHSGDSNLETAFQWLNNEPRKFEFGSISFALALEVALLGSVAFGTAIMFAGRANSAWLWSMALGLGLLYMPPQLFIYWLILRG
jgi:hypothetical protein